MFRQFFLTFTGKPRDHHRYEHAHESPRAMSWPLVFLAVLSVCAGWVALPWLSHGFSSFVYFDEVHHAKPEYLLMLVSTIVAVSGIGLAYLMYYKGSISPDRMAARFKPVYTFLYNKWYFDELYNAVIIQPLLKLSSFMWIFDARVIDGLVNLVGRLTVLWSDVKMWFDKWIIDGAVNGSGWLVTRFGGGLRQLQSGAVQFYALFIMIIVVLVGLFKFEMVHIDITWPVLSIIFVVGVFVLAVMSAIAAAREKAASRIDQDK
jgi:NADH-quinone oxidoreductase subunit L